MRAMAAANGPKFVIAALAKAPFACSICEEFVLPDFSLATPEADEADDAEAVDVIAVAVSELMDRLKIVSFVQDVTIGYIGLELLAFMVALPARDICIGPHEIELFSND